MKKTAVILFIALVFIFAGCKTDDASKQGTGETKFGENTAMSWTNGEQTFEISLDMYNFYLSKVKTQTLYRFFSSVYSANDMSAPNPATITEPEAFWTNMYSESETNADIVKIQTESTLKKILAVYAYCKENGIELTEDEQNGIDGFIENIINSDKYGSSKDEFDKVLKRFNINDTIYREIKRYETYDAAFEDRLFNPDTGVKKITDEMIDEVYQTMARYKHILLFHKEPGYYMDDGSIVDTMTKAQDLYDRIMDGEDFDVLTWESADRRQTPPDGYTVDPKTFFMKEFSDAIIDMEIGEVRIIEYEAGIYIMKRYELLPADIACDDYDTGASWKYIIENNFKIEVLEEELTPYIEKVQVNTAKTDLFEVEPLDMMLDCWEIIR